MKHYKSFFQFLMVTMFLVVPAGEARAAQPDLTIAVLPFDVSGDDKVFVEKLLQTMNKADMPKANTTGEEFSILLMNQLTATHGLSLVERHELDKALSEMELGLSGTIDPETAARIGHLVGAKVIVTGRMFAVSNNLVIVSKILSVETGRVYGETVTLPNKGQITDAAVEMAAKVATTISSKSETLMAKEEKKESVADRLRPQLAPFAGWALPVISVRINENHGDKDAPDPAAETEIGMILQQLGFKVVDPVSSATPADVEITGEAFSEFGLRKGNLVSSRGRVEIKAVERISGEILLTDREADAGVDLSPQMAGHMAIQKAAGSLTERLVPALLKLAKKPAEPAIVKP